MDFSDDNITTCNLTVEEHQIEQIDNFIKIGDKVKFKNCTFNKVQYPELLQLVQSEIGIIRKYEEYYYYVEVDKILKYRGDEGKFYVIQDTMVRVSLELFTELSCTCSIQDLMTGGCKCGQFKREQAVALQPRTWSL